MRKLAVAAAVSLALASGGARALILGEIDMRSALNQPMNAEIRLASVESGELDGMIVKLASPEAFTRAGIDRSNALNDLDFAVVSNNDGDPVIRITSKKPVLEPFLNFLLEVDWTRGRMVREYTVLLDPPVFMTPTATQRNTVGDTPAVVDSSADDSILTPIAIDRSGAAPFDESSVVVVGDSVDISDAQGGVEVNLDELVTGGEVVDLGDLGDSTSQGTVVSLDGLDDELLGTQDPSAVTLSDPSVQNTEVTYDGSTWNAETGWEVVVVGDTNEVGDDVGAPVPQTQAVSLSESVSLDDLETVSLDDLDVSGGSGGGSVEVRENDTLFEIARNNQVQGLSTEQMMLALLDANQQAFINGNINLVKAGAILRIPEASEVAGLSQSDAVAQVGVQAQLWREYRDNLRGSSSNTQIAEADTPAAAPADTSIDVADSDNSTIAETSAETESATSDATDLAANTSGAGASNDASTTSEDTAGENTLASVDAGAVSGATDAARNELKIVADNQSSSTVASTTADESDSPDAARLGEINLKLQLAREELAAARLEAGELSEQNTELESMTENMDQLVTMRQDQLAKLQAQLEAAREDADLTPADADVTAENGATVTDATDVAATDTDVAGAVADATAAAANNATDTVSAVADQASDEAAETVANVAGSVADGTDNTAAGATETIAAATQAQPWYKQYLSDPKTIGLGVGGLALGGLAFALLRRRKRDDVEDDLDEVVFMSDDETLADAAPVAAAGEVGDDQADAVAAIEETVEPTVDSEFEEDKTVSLDDAVAAPAETENADPKDDTVSEAEVYLAYGLHGQAEELLGRAIEKEPDNADYRFKLMQTYHSQSKSSEFEELATDYHERFGGNGSPEWSSVLEMGKEMNPSNPLFLESGAGVESLGRGDLDAPKLDMDDFLEDKSSEDSDGVSSQVREFSSSDDEAVDMIDEDSPLDQTMDPALAFDESDLEATGDFTQLSNELAGTDASNDASGGGLEFPSDLADGISDKVTGAAAGVAGAVGLSGLASGNDDNADADSLDFDADLSALGDGTVDAGNIDLDADVNDLSSLLSESDETAAVSADDLTVDLDKLEGDLNFDGGDTLDGGLDLTQDLDIPDLDSVGDLTADASAAFGNVDEMETMMDLAKAYIDMGDNDSASSALGEIVKSGSPEQKTEAESLLKKIS